MVIRPRALRLHRAKPDGKSGTAPVHSVLMPGADMRWKSPPICTRLCAQLLAAQSWLRCMTVSVQARAAVSMAFLSSRMSALRLVGPLLHRTGRSHSPQC